MLNKFLESNHLLDTVASETEATSDEVRRLTNGLSEAQLNWKPAAESWSIAQCLDHLAVAEQKFEPYMTAAIERGRAKWPVKGAVAYRPTLLGGWLIKQLVPEAVRRVPSPKIFRPPDASAIEGSPDRFLRQQETFLRFVHDAEGLDYNKTRLRSPVIFLMRYSLADAFVINAVHGRRHFDQMRRVRETTGFPSN